MMVFSELKPFLPALDNLKAKRLFILKGLLISGAN